MKKIIIAFIIILCAVYFTEKNHTAPIKVERITVASDKNSNGRPDCDDFIEGARSEVKNKTKYKDAYYSGGYPPDGEGVCTDLVWRAFQNAGYDLKSMVDEDIKLFESEYLRITGGPDPNIDFRRVPNLKVFFQRHALVLTNELIPRDPENLRLWQGGDIVITDKPQHIAILSDKRDKNGVPYVIHNAGPVPREQRGLEHWKITGHFRYPKE